MSHAIELAYNGRYSVSPNPKVGCVIAHGEKIVGSGWHRQKGGAHAEIFALQQAGNLAENSTVYVSLEPCSHYGATPPCAKALIAAKVKKVIAATQDANPLVQGKGFAMLQNAGIEVACGLLEKETRELNRGFFSRFERNRPYIRLKIAQSLDGKTALKNGVSQWITNNESRLDVQEQRAISCAILTGVGTILADNPRLNVREIETFRQPVRVVVDSNLSTPPNANICIDNQRTILACLPNAQNKDYPDNVEILRIDANENQQIDLKLLLTRLSEMGFGEVLVEAGAILSGALLQENLVDELLIYQAPIILGNTARSSFRLPEKTDLSNLTRWHLVDSKTFGDDIRLTFKFNTNF